MNETPVLQPQSDGWKKQFTTVTPYSKYLALTMLVLLPFGGFYLGTKYGADSLVEQGQKPTTFMPVSSKSEEVSSSATQGELPFYRFDFFSNDPKLLDLEGLLTPIKIGYGSPAFRDEDVNIRCWSDDMVCAFAGRRNDNEPHKRGYFHNPSAGLLEISDWSESNLVAKGIIGYTPACEKHTCGADFELFVDFANKTARIVHTVCYVGCAADEYLLVGDGDGTHESRSDLPEPEVKLIPII